jgi:dienelactone hydrolase
LEKSLPQTSGFPANKSFSTGISILRSVSIFILIMILLGLTGIGLVGLVVHFKERREVVLPKPSGPYAVGRSLFDWTDSSREDPYSSSIGKYRELMVWLWYPAASAPGAAAAEYIPAAWAAKLPWRPVTIPARIRVHAVSDAPLAGKDQAYPVVVFSTGFGNLPSDYTSVMEDLASRGYVVLGITNTYSAPVVRFPDGRVAEPLRAASFPRGPIAAVQSAGDRMVNVWAADVRFSLDMLAKMNADPQSRFYGRFDMQKVGFLGHSFGGAAAAEACSTDPRCKAGIDLDGNLFGGVLKTGIKQPFLFILSDWTLGPSWVQRTLSGVTLQKMKAHQSDIEHEMQDACKDSSQCWDTHIQGTRHFNFTDVAVLYSPGMKLTGFLGPVDGRKGLDEAAACIGTFFAAALNGQSPSQPDAGQQSGCHYSRVDAATGEAPKANR